MPDESDPAAQGSRRLLVAIGAAGLWALLLYLALHHPPDGHEHGNLGQFLGRLHPLLVHGPVAFLILVPLLELAGLSSKRAYLRAAAGWILAVSAIAAFAAAYDGWLLAWSEGLRGRDVTRHMWGGVWLAGVSALAAWARGSRIRGAYPLLLIGCVTLMIWTAHGGGSITHGESYLTEKMPARLRTLLGMPAKAPEPLAPAATATVAIVHGGPGSIDPANPAFFAVHVAPILSRSCISCHRPEKHKGGLRMDSYALLMQGGDDGAALIPGNAKGSELIRRVSLPASDDDYMPSDGEKPLTPEEIQTLVRWIAAGAKGG